MTNLFDFSLEGKTALITGAGSGIGAAIADAFDQKGARLLLVDMSRDIVDAACKKYKNASAFECNVADQSQVQMAVDAASKAYGRIDILVNCAGIVDLAPAATISANAWKRTIDVNLSGSFYVAQAVGQIMIAQKYGRIINLASQAGSVAIDEHVAYCASKFGVIGLTKTLALEWGQHGITVNSISPTVVLTELGKKAWDGPKGEAMKAQIPTGRFAEPEEIAACAVYLASDAAAMLNGADIIIDGGFTIK